MVDQVNFELGFHEACPVGQTLMRTAVLSAEWESEGPSHDVRSLQCVVILSLLFVQGMKRCLRLVPFAPLYHWMAHTTESSHSDIA